MIVCIGGVGYIGSVVLDYVDKICGSASLCMDNLTYTDDYNRHMFNNVDITDKDALHQALDRHPSISCIIHMAAIVGDGACNVDPAKTMAVNIDGTRNIVEWIKRRNASSDHKVRLVYASTCSVYGESSELLNEESVANPISLYAETKLIGEGLVKEVEDHLIFRLGTIHGLNTHQTYGRIRSDLVVNTMTFAASLGNPINVYGKNQWRPFIHVMDVGRLIAFGAVGSFRGTYILAKDNLTLGDVAEHIGQCIDGTTIITYEGKAQDMRNYRVDNGKAKSVGLIPQMSIYNGITQMRDAIRNKRIKNPWLSKYNNAKYLQELHNAR